MASTKDAVEQFLQLGAKYEVVLVGLADDVRKQNYKVDEIDQLARTTAGRASEAMGNVNTAINEVRASVASAERAIAHAVELTDKTTMLHESTEKLLQQFRSDINDLTAQLGHTTKQLYRSLAFATALGVIALIVGVVAVLR
jgi:CHASE3 domain sensor protein